MTRESGDVDVIIARAAPPPERADRHLFEPVPTREPARTLRRSQLDAAFADPERLERHAEALGLTPAQWLSRFGDVRLAGPAPAWAVAFRAIRERLLDPSAPLEGALRWAAGEVLRDWPRNLPRNDGVLDAALHYLARRVRTALQPSWHSERTLGIRIGWRQRFERSPVVAYVVGRLVADWCADMARIARRAADDRARLADSFCRGADPGVLERIDPGKGDPHASGQSVAILHFERCVVVYKPKDLRVASAVGKIVDFLRHEGLGAPNLLFRGDYAWEAFHEPAPIGGKPDADTFYGALGRWLALLQVCGGLDFWFDNLIAEGKTARFIDFETAAQPATRRNHGLPPGSTSRMLELVVESLSMAGILPFPCAVGDGRDPVDLGCLTRPGRHVLPFPDRTGDGMSVWTEDRFAPHHATGVPADAADHFDAFERGYLRAARALSARGGRECVIESLAAIGGAPVRIILLDTWTCYRAMQHSLIPRSLADAAWREIALHARVGRLTDTVGVMREAIVRDLRQLDVPLFHCQLGSTDLIGMGGERAPGFFAESALSAVPERVDAVAGTGEDDLRACLRTIFGTRPGTARPRSGGSRTGRQGASDADLLAWADDIATDIASHARPGPHGAPTWMGETHDVFRGLRRLDWIGFDVLCGHAGLAISLLELSLLLSRRDLASLAQDALAGAAEAYLSRIEWNLSAGAGYVTGAAGLIVALRRVPELQARAREVYERACSHEIWMRSGCDRVSGLEGWRAAARAVGAPAPAAHGRGRPYAPSSLPRLAPWLDPENAGLPCSDRRSALSMRRDRDRIGTWFAGTWTDDRHHLSGVDGLPALAICFARLAQDAALVLPAVSAPAGT